MFKHPKRTTNTLPIINFEKTDNFQATKRLEPKQWEAQQPDADCLTELATEAPWRCKKCTNEFTSHKFTFLSINKKLHNLIQTDNLIIHLRIDYYCTAHGNMNPVQHVTKRINFKNRSLNIFCCTPRYPVIIYVYFLTFIPKFTVSLSGIIVQYLFSHNMSERMDID